MIDRERVCAHTILQRPIRSLGIALFLVASLLVALPALADQGQEELSWLPSARLQQSQDALQSLTGDYPMVQAYKSDHLVTRLYGAPFGYGNSPEQTAEQFLSEHATVFGVSASDLVPGNASDGKLVSQPVMYDRATGNYKFTLLYYSQYHDGMPVFQSELRLLVRNEPNYPLVLAASTLRDMGTFEPDRALAGVQSDRAKDIARTDVPSLDKFSEQKAVIWAGANSDLEEPHTAVTFVGSSDFPERYRYVIDPVSGDILYKESLIIFENIVGDVDGLATQGYRSEQCEDEIAEPMPYARVSAGVNLVYADSLGNFTIPNSGTGEVIVQSWIRGQWFKVNNFTGSDAVLADTITPPGPVNFLQNAANAAAVRAQVNAYVEANALRSRVTEYNPSFPGTAQAEFPIYVNRTDGYCPGNAWYDPADVSMNFCSAGSGYPNTAWGSVLHHEYGHRLVDAAGSGQGQYGEGMGDCMSVIMSDNSELGVGFYGNCTQSLRSANNTMQYPCTGAIHTCGQLLSGCVWDTRNALAANYPDTYLEILSGLVVNSILLHTGTEITPQITIDFLTLDDNDGALGNGTPHHAEICEGFGLHNMACPALAPIWFEYPDGKPAMVLPNDETPVRVVVHDNAATAVPGSGVLHYSVDGGAWQIGTMTEISANVYDAILPPTGCLSRIDWYVTAETSESEVISDPETAPTSTFSAMVATSSVTAFEDNFETNKGWTVSGNATDGQWTRGVPAGDGSRGDPTTDFDGSGQCYLTDNVSGNSDVDGGTTSLTSPTINLSAGDARVSYARWYSNTAGDAPNADTMKVYISNNGGTSWVLVERVGPVEQASGGWYTHSFWVGSFVTPTASVRLRFDASDLGTGSVVEAGVDAVLVTTFECSSTDLTIITSSLPDWTQGVPFSRQIETINAVGTVTFTDLNGDLIGTGLSVSSSGLISGTPTASGDISFTVEATDEAPITTRKALAVHINVAVSITQPTLPEWTQGRAYPSTQLQATGGTGAIAWADLNGDLSSTGLTLSATGLLSGTPAIAGPINFTARATDNLGGAGDRALSIAINSAVAVTSLTLPDGDESEPYAYQLTSSGGTGTKLWSAVNGLTGSGLTLSSTGLLSGAVSADTTFVFTAKVTDAVGASDSRPLTVNIVGGCCVDPTVGNIDGSADELVTMSDLTVLIDHLFITLSPLACLQEADLDQSGGRYPQETDITMSDLTVMIDHLFITLATLPSCP
jgi:hypothetical protein